MKRRKATSKATKPTSVSAELARIWQAANQAIFYEQRGLIDHAMRGSVAPFVEAAIELAAAALADPREDLTPLLHPARVALDAAIQLLPSIEDCFDDAAPTAKATKTWQVALVRDAVKIIRSFSSPPEALQPVPRSDEDYEPYTPKRAADLENPDPSKLWMIEHLWQRSAAGIIGGGAKGCKTWLALDIALSVASATSALDRFPVHQSGGVLYVNAEGGEAYIKNRLNALCVHRGLHLDSLPHEIHIIPSAIRIDTADGIGRLKATIRELAPTLLVLDPLVRLHRGDENSASTVSNLLSALSELQQAFNLSLILVHHSTKQGARRAEMNGQDFRGSGDFHAWGSSNIAIRRKDSNRFIVSAEHRAAPSTEKWTLRATTDEHPRLEIIGDDDDGGASADASSDGANGKLDSDIYELLSAEPQSGRSVRSKVPGGTDRILESMKRLKAQQKIVRVGRRWAAANGSTRRS